MKNGNLLSSRGPSSTTFCLTWAVVLTALREAEAPQPMSSKDHQWAEPALHTDLPKCGTAGQ
eukprot:CAMPEP_0115310066 /NCGR_PEP_ID=MMETSP0270-20121206/74598_1 /TAXON_ID=71861 /ORGANISM="Scrippsiella trochoidea, Strain CCMP3099" /LENGTH=61 /DNA_ID=CAMNT_0002728795 /DNA_START=1133 /DNA_END=1319 /DNA_ORIENTATION=-